MKRTTLFLSLLALYISSNAQQGLPVPVPGKVENAVICKADGTQSYALYIPLKGNGKALPVVFFFDPHGEGSLPLNRYRTLGEAYGFILVGSNNSKNGNDWPKTENIWNKLFSDVRERLKIDERRLYVCGFSGGAKVASYVAIQHPGIRGVIAGGAGLPDGVSADNFPFSFTVLAGEGDMNLTELAAVSAALDKTQTRHRLIGFDGKHDWAPLPVMDRAFAGWQLEAMHDRVLPQDPAFVRRIIAADKSRVEMAIRAGEYIRAEQACRVAASYLDGLTPEADGFRRKAAALDSDPKYKRQQQARDATFAREAARKSEFMNEFQQGDNKYWQQTIRQLESGAEAAGAEKGMYQRLIAYLSLAFYSISNQMIGAGRNDPARHFVELYKMADPGNSEAWYFSAVLDIREGHAAVAQADLQKAISLGFKDRARLSAQPEFQKGLGAGAIAQLESRMVK
ncbi:MAG TPA: hypothetical protein VHE34_17000 [Puia sp.]|uniref:hypothetical protein n=1 Tax=Puia sp. TaxID=2045100 RepID=UPI002C1FACB1|nr:hypothetical protein [Puia sp.]HVU96932.1 hypothetical protein [Puia sp.]